MKVKYLCASGPCGGRGLRREGQHAAREQPRVSRTIAQLPVVTLAIQIGMQVHIYRCRVTVVELYSEFNS